MFSQLVAGVAISILNFGIHAMTTGLIVVATRRAAGFSEHMHVFGRVTILLLIAVTVLTIAHLLEVSVWAVYFSTAGISPGPEISSFDFAFENYVALGYGDVVPPPQQRLYGPLAALNGLLLVGWSVAIIFEVLRMAEVQISRRHRTAG